MILADTSIWVDHFRRSEPRLETALIQEVIMMHPFVLGELACGNLRNRVDTLALLGELPQVPIAREQDVHHLLDSRGLWGRGLGWIDVHLLAAALTSHCTLWTHDKALASVATFLGISF